VAERLASPAVRGPTLLTALVAMVCHGSAQSALPPAEGKSAPKPVAVGTPTSDSSTGVTWILPPIRFGGTVAYYLRRDSSDEQSSKQSGLSTTLNASTNSYIWRPWFARVNGSLGFTTSTNSSESNEAASSGKNVVVTGSGQLSVLSQSKFPFEAHFQRSNSSVSNDLAVANGYASQQYGFTQRYRKKDGDAMFGWDRNSQTSADNVSDLQDSLRLTLSHRLEKHQMQFSGDRVTNARESTGDNAAQTSFSFQDSYSPSSTVSVDSLVNISQSDYHLQQSDNKTQLLQLSSNAFWRPEDVPLTVTGGFRFFALGTDSTGLSANGSQTENRLRNASANLAASYEFNKYVRLSAGINANMVDSNGVKTETINLNSNQTLSANYSPEAIALGAFKYNWGTSASLGNNTQDDSSNQQLALQFTHSLSRSIKLDGGSTVAMEVSQGLAAAANSNASDSNASTKQLTHSGSVSWDMSQQVGAPQLRLTASDSRALDGQQEFFQIINFQASSNLPTSGYSSWTGNLTIQATRQGGKSTGSSSEPISGFVTNSGGSISYQNQRFLGNRRLRFGSDLRLNSLALLPLLGGSGDQEAAAWDNRLDYSIGRTQLRVNLQVSSSTGQKRNVDPVTKAESVEEVKRINKSIMFSVSRSFGNI
jgi:hypothetical protein